MLHSQLACRIPCWGCIGLSLQSRTPQGRTGWRQGCSLCSLLFSSLPPSSPSLLSLLCIFKQVTASEPSNTEGLYSLAQVYYSLNNIFNLPKSEEFLQKVLKLSPNHRDALHYLGQIHYRGQSYGQAATVWRKLASLGPGHRDVAALLKVAEKYSK